METPVDNDPVDEITPHSDVGGTDGGGFDFPKVETPFLNDPSVRPVSPVSSNNMSITNNIMELDFSEQIRATQVFGKHPKKKERIKRARQKDAQT